MLVRHADIEETPTPHEGDRKTPLEQGEGKHGGSIVALSYLAGTLLVMWEGF